MSALQNPVKANKIRLNLSLSPAAVEAGKRLAQAENRSFSNTLEVLIERASKATKLPEAPAPAVPQEQAA